MTYSIVVCKTTQISEVYLDQRPLHLTIRRNEEEPSNTGHYSSTVTWPYVLHTGSSVSDKE